MLTDEEMERRRDCVGASEMGLLFGFKGYQGKTVSDLWAEKKYGVTQSKDTKATDMGKRLEPIVLEEAEQRLGRKIVDRQKWFRLDANGATIDGRIEGDGPLVEAKTSGIVGPGNLSEWGEEYSDTVSDQYLIQVQAQLLVTGAEMAYLAALIGGRGFALFQIMPHAALMQAIKEKAREFIASLAGDVAPGEPPTLDTLKRLKRQPKSIVERSDKLDELFDKWMSAKASASVADKAKDLAQRELLAALGNAEAAEVSGGLLTYYEQTRAGYYAAESTFRVPRFQKGK